MIDYPKVSVVTITYDHENYITQTLDGVIMQDYPGEIEFIIANDNSPDATDKVVEDYFSNRRIPDNFIIKYTRHKSNKGMMPNFVWALEQASGKYIALCEGDDYWINSLKIQKQVDFLEKNEDVTLCFHAADHYSQTTGKLSRSIELETREYSGEEFLRNWIIPTASVLFRQKFLDHQIFNRLLNPNYKSGDTVLFLSMAEKGKIFCANEVLSIYRVHDTSMIQSSYKNRGTRNTGFINHHKQMSKDLDGRYKKINNKIIAEQYYNFILGEKNLFRKTEFLMKFNYYTFKVSKSIFFSKDHIKTTLYHLVYFFQDHKM